MDRLTSWKLTRGCPTHQFLIFKFFYQESSLQIYGTNPKINLTLVIHQQKDSPLIKYFSPLFCQKCPFYAHSNKKVSRSTLDIPLAMTLETCSRYIFFSLPNNTTRFIRHGLTHMALKIQIDAENRRSLSHRPNETHFPNVLNEKRERVNFGNNNFIAISIPLHSEMIYDITKHHISMPRYVHAYKF